MTTLLSELVRSLSVVAARDLRARVDKLPLSRAELLALATLNELAAALLSAGAPPAELAAARDMDSMEPLAAFDMQVVTAARNLNPK